MRARVGRHQTLLGDVRSSSSSSSVAILAQVSGCPAGLPGAWAPLPPWLSDIASAVTFPFFHASSTVRLLPRRNGGASASTPTACSLSCTRGDIHGFRSLPTARDTIHTRCRTAPSSCAGTSLLAPVQNGLHVHRSPDGHQARAQAPCFIL